MLECLFDVQFPMCHGNSDVELPCKMLGKMLRTIDRPVLSSGAAEADLKMGELPLNKALDMGIDQCIHAVQEGENLAVILEELDDFLVKAGELTIELVLSRVVHRTAVEYVTASVS